MASSGAAAARARSAARLGVAGRAVGGGGADAGQRVAGQLPDAFTDVVAAEVFEYIGDAAVGVRAAGAAKPFIEGVLHQGVHEPEPAGTGRIFTDQGGSLGRFE